MDLKNSSYKIPYDVTTYYCNLESPQFALQIEGQWGCGKSWFIHEFISNYLNDVDAAHKDTHFILTSLFGLTSIADIRINILSQLLALKSGTKSNILSDGMSFLSKFGILKLKDKIGLEQFHSFYDLFISKIKSTFGKIIFVFDDYERNKIGDYEIMGYISKLLFEYKCNVIIIANTESLRYEQTKINSQFIINREKIIGMITHVEPSFDNVFASNLENNLHQKEFISLFEKNKKELVSIFNDFGNKNLRDFDKLCLNFRFLYTHMTNEMLNDEEFMSNMLRLCFKMIIMSFGNKDFYFSTFGQSLDFWPGLGTYSFHSDNDTKGISSLKSFYRNDDPHDYPMSPRFWMNFLCEGKIDEYVMIEYYSNSKVDSEQSPIPMRLIHVFEIDSEDAKHLLVTMQEEMLKGTYTQPGLLLHALGTLLFYVEHGILDMDKKTAIKICKDSISNTKFLIDSEDFFISHTDSWGGYVFLQKETHEFSELYTILKNSYMQQKEAITIDSMNTFMLNISSNINEALTFFNSCSPLYDMIDLNHLDPHKFGELICTIKSNFHLHLFQKYLFEMLYKKTTLGHSHRDDSINWSRKLRDNLIYMLTEDTNIDPLIKYNLHNICLRLESIY